MELSRIENLVRPVIEKSGFELYDIEFGGKTLRIMIEKDGGVTVSDCADVSKILGPLLDVEEVTEDVGSYELEVSSPGLDRILKRPQHFTRVIGEKIHVKTKDPLSQWNGSDKYYEGRRNITGELKASDEHKITVVADGRDTQIPMNVIQKAHVIFEVEKGQKKGKKSHGR